MSLEITATIDLLRDYVLRAQTAIRALEELEGKGIIPAGTVQTPEESVNKAGVKKPRPAAIAKRVGRPPKAAVAEAGFKACTKCGKTKSVSEFACGGKKPYCKACECAYQRARYAARKMERSTASGPLPFVCDICHSKFSSRSNLDTHMELKHGEQE